MLKILIFIFIACLAVYVLKTEKKDLTCPQGPLTKDTSLCREGNGKTYHQAIPSVKDSTITLLKKIKIAALAGRKDVYWRRAFIVACLCTLFIYLTVIRCVPSVSDAVLMIFIITIFMYVTNSLYNYHHYGHIEGNIIQSIDILDERRKKINRKKV